MTAFRIFLATLFISIVLYTVPVVLNHGFAFQSVFFGDIQQMGWAGQFNVDFLGFLMLSAFWTAWRNRFSPSGLLLGVLALLFGAPFLSAYLLYLSVVCDRNVQIMLLGENRTSD